MLTLGIISASQGSSHRPAPAWRDGLGSGRRQHPRRRRRAAAYPPASSAAAVPPASPSPGLIRAAASVGWNIAVSSDFEPRGLHGAITLLRHLQSAGQPWRLTAAEYLAAPAEGEPFSPGQVPHTPWDPALADAMRQRRERVSEEARIASLLADLQRRSAPSSQG